MRIITGLICLIILCIAIYYFSINNLRSFAVSIINFGCLIFLISKKSDLKSLLYALILSLAFFEVIVFTFHILSSLDFDTLSFRSVFQEDYSLSRKIYRFKGDLIFRMDKNLVASLFAVLTLIFKQFNKKFLTFISFILLVYTFSRSAIIVTLLLLIFPYKKIKLKYLYSFFGILLVFFLSYSGENYGLNLKRSTYILFYEKLSTITPIEFLLGSTSFSFESQNRIMQELGTLTLGHTLAGSLLTYGIIYFVASGSVLFIVWKRHENLRIPILFIIVYSLFSVTSLSIPLPLILVATVFDNKIKIAKKLFKT
tara:strand:- start:1218 stop:2153 length:936 start_codon:yes stop_codon:yes gene_type:complete